MRLRTCQREPTQKPAANTAEIDATARSAARAISRLVYRSMMRSRSAIATACVRLAAPSLRAAVCVCSSTVRLEMLSALLIFAAGYVFERLVDRPGTRFANWFIGRPA